VNISQADPVPMRLTGSIILAVKGNGRDRINLRSAPDDKSKVITSVPYGTIFAAVGVSSNRNWVRLQNANYEGWVARSSLFAPGNLESLPVLR
jgi:SH3-like domain-containing protein